MSANRIGGFDFIYCRGAPQTVAERMETITRPGVDGVAFRKVGKVSEPFEVMTLCDYASAAAAATAQAAHKAIQGTLVSYHDGGQNQWSNVAVHLVEATGAIARTVTPVGGVSGGAWLLAERWVLQCTTIP